MISAISILFLKITHVAGCPKEGAHVKTTYTRNHTHRHADWPFVKRAMLLHEKKKKCRAWVSGRSVFWSMHDNAKYECFASSLKNKYIRHRFTSGEEQEKKSVVATVPSPPSFQTSNGHVRGPSRNHTDKHNRLRIRGTPKPERIENTLC